MGWCLESLQGLYFYVVSFTSTPVKMLCSDRQHPLAAFLRASSVKLRVKEAVDNKIAAACTF